MPLTTYSELQASIAGWLNRGDLTEPIKDFSALAESRFQDKLRAREMIVRDTLAVSSQYTALPESFVEMQQVSIASPYKKLGLLNNEQMAEQRERTIDVPGIPSDFAVVGSELEISPTPGTATTLNLVFFEKITPLSAAAPTNWLLTKYPDLYLFGALISSAPYLHDDSRFQLWVTAHDARLEEINQTGRAAKYSGATPRQKLRPMG